MDNVAYAVEIARELHALGTFGHNGPPFDWGFCMYAFSNVCMDPNRYGKFAVDDDGVFVGGVVGHVDTFMFSPRLMGIEDGWYVREGTPKRASIAMRLMRGFVDWCLDEKGALLVQTGDIAAIHSHAVHVLYRHMGFKQFGTVYKFQRNV
jgi:hypothetical protein